MLPVYLKKVKIIRLITIFLIFIFIACAKGPNFLLSQAKELLNKKEYMKAANIFQQFVYSYPKDIKVSEAYFYLGDIYNLYKKNTEEAIRYYREVCKRGLGDKDYIFDAQWKIAELFMEDVQDYDQAIVEYRAFIDINDNDYRSQVAQIRIAECYNLLKYFSQATTEYELFLKNYSNSKFQSQIHFRLGNLYLQENSLNEAIIYYKKVIDETFDKNILLKSKYSLAECYYKKGSIKEALTIYNHLYNNNSWHKDILRKKIDYIEKNFYIVN